MGAEGWQESSGKLLMYIREDGHAGSARDIANTFGVPVEEHKRQMEVSELDGLVSFGALTSPRREKKE